MNLAGWVPSGTHEPLRAYAEQATRPLASLLFVIPLMVAYEAGILLWPTATRNGADVWLRTLLQWTGFGQYFLLPLLTCAALLAWHHIRQDAWQVRQGTLLLMACESFGWACVLWGWAHVHHDLWPVPTPREMVAIPCAWNEEATAPAWLIAFCGAGLYEELLFRLLLLPSLALLLRLTGVSISTSLWLAIVLNSLLFAAAHYRWDISFGTWSWQSSLGDPFQWRSFWFRTTAGLFFSFLFRHRGFGIAAGSHACYDILVWL